MQVFCELIVQDISFSVHYSFVWDFRYWKMVQNFQILFFVNSIDNFVAKCDEY